MYGDDMSILRPSLHFWGPWNQRPHLEPRVFVFSRNAQVQSVVMLGMNWASSGLLCENTGSQVVIIVWLNHVCNMFSNSYLKHASATHESLLTFWFHMFERANMRWWLPCGARYVFVIFCLADFQGPESDITSSIPSYQPHFGGQESPPEWSYPKQLFIFSFRGKQSLLPACFCSRPQKICGSQH